MGGLEKSDEEQSEPESSTNTPFWSLFIWHFSFYEIWFFVNIEIFSFPNTAGIEVLRYWARESNCPQSNLHQPAIVRIHLDNYMI